MSAPFFQRGVFNDFDQLREGVQGWSLDWNQLDGGRLTATISQVATPSVLVSHASFDKSFVQRGASPPGVQTFGLMETGSAGVRWCSRPFMDDGMAVFARTGEYESVSGPDFDCHSIAIAEPLLAQAYEALELPGLEGGDARIMTCDAEAVEDARRAIRRVHEVAASGLGPRALAALRDELENEVPVRLVKTLAAGRGEVSPPAFGTRELAIRRALPFIESQRDELITISDLCQATRLSRRTLHYAFKEHFGVTPKAYLTAIRLEAVRRELVPGAPPVKVADVANRWGFWHMGRFASDYRRHFGELPSKTLRRRSGVPVGVRV